MAVDFLLVSNDYLDLASNEGSLKKKWQNMIHSELYIALVSYEIMDYCLNGIVLKKSFQNIGILQLAENVHFQHF